MHLCYLQFPPPLKFVELVPISGMKNVAVRESKIVNKHLYVECKQQIYFSKVYKSFNIYCQ